VPCVSSWDTFIACPHATTTALFRQYTIAQLAALLRLCNQAKHLTPRRAGFIVSSILIFFRLLGAVFLLLGGLFPQLGAATGVDDSNSVLQVHLLDTENDRSHIALWSLEELCDLPAESLTTTTPWTNGVQTFSGVSVGVLLNEIGVTSGEVELRASNDYRVTTTVAELRTAGALLAYRRNDTLMQTRDKGPLWMVFAYDATPDLRRETIYSLSVWQPDQIRISR